MLGVRTCGELLEKAAVLPHLFSEKTAEALLRKVRAEAPDCVWGLGLGFGIWGLGLPKARAVTPECDLAHCSSLRLLPTHDRSSSPPHHLSTAPPRHLPG